jgi:hypothetical protein
MESYKLYVNKKDDDDKNLKLKLNGINKNLVDNTYKSIENSKKNSDYDQYSYQDSLIGDRISRLTNKNTRISHMVGNKAISFSSLVE